MASLRATISAWSTEVVFVPALANDLAGAIEDDAADGGVGRGDADAAAGEFEGALHPVEVFV